MLTKKEHLLGVFGKLVGVRKENEEIISRLQYDLYANLKTEEEKNVAIEKIKKLRSNIVQGILQLLAEVRDIDSGDLTELALGGEENLSLQNFIKDPEDFIHREAFFAGLTLIEEEIADLVLGLGMKVDEAAYASGLSLDVAVFVRVALEIKAAILLDKSFDDSLDDVNSTLKRRANERLGE